jgi:hypothetical protein
VGEGAVSRREFARELYEGALLVAYGVTKFIAVTVVWVIEGRKR